MLLLVAVAFVAGVVTALSPCVLPALPVVLAGTATGGSRRLIGVAVGFVLGFTLFTLSLTFALRAIGVSPTSLRNAAIALLVAFGAALLIPRLDARLGEALAPLGRLGARMPTSGGDGAAGLAVGGALGLVWTPCAGPIFAAIAAAAASGGAGPTTFAVLAAYSLGAVLPLVAVGFGGQRLARRLGARARALRPALGALMVAAGAILFLGVDTRLTETVTRDLPGYTETLQSLERTDAVRRRLPDVTGAGSGAPPLVEAARGAEPDQPDPLGLPDAGPAPEVRGITAWFNTRRPQTLRQLRGRVVLLDFWTYSCANCLRTLPHLADLHRRYARDGLTVLGVHTPEFLFEAEPGNVARAVRDLDVPYPVALDASYRTWLAYGNQYWPAHYLIDRRGHVRDLYVGEGGYAQTEALVRRALGLPPADIAEGPSERPGHNVGQTPETFLGHARLMRLASLQPLRRERRAGYAPPLRLPTDGVAFDGQLTVLAQEVVAGRDAAVEINFRARDVFLVLDGNGQRRLGRVLLDGRPLAGPRAGADIGPGGALTVEGARLYSLVNLPRRGTGRLRVELAPGTRAFSFTFGSGSQEQPARPRT